MRIFLERPVVLRGRFLVAKRRKDPAFAFFWHHHDEYELTLMVRSRGRRFVGDHIGTYQPGDMAFVGPRLPHCWVSAPETKGQTHDAIVVQFSPSLLGPGRLEDPDLGAVWRLFKRSRYGLHVLRDTRTEIAARLVRLLDLPPLGQLGELLLILERLARSRDLAPLSARAFVPEAPAEQEHPASRICRYINDHALGPIRFEEVARLAAMSPASFSRFFNRATGRTFLSYVTELRIAHACRLLMETERSIADVANASGFSNLSNFNRRFLALKQMRPREFRQAFRFYAEGESKVRRVRPETAVASARRRR